MPIPRTLLLALAVASCATVLMAQSKNLHDQKHQILVATDSDGYGVGVETLDPKLLGVAIYPGAHADETENDGKGANLYLEWGQESTHLYVEKFLTPDPPDKVLAFYRKQLARYGAVLECRDGKPVAKVETDLKCDANDNQDDTHRPGIELMAGTQARQHVVGIETKGGSTSFGIVYLEQTRRGTI